MSDESIFLQAWNEIIEDSEVAQECYLSLYENVSYYGGPEEGGWWDSDVILVSSQMFLDEQSANDAVEKINAIVEQENADAKKAFGERCLREVEFCDARGLDADYLPEVDGEETYFVTIEERKGEGESEGCRHYE